MFITVAKPCYGEGMIIGVDEVGRGSWAGPLCVAAVAWPDDAPTKGLADSKKLTAVKRQAMVAHIKQYAHAIGIGWMAPAQIDAMGMGKALHVAARAAVAQIGEIAPIIVDGRDKLLDAIPAEYLIKADDKIPAVMAASIIAKVARDTYMASVDAQFTGYNFAQHVGYGTKAHQAAIKLLGPCALHRMSYAPLRVYVT